jgi:hypothetical protein
MKKLINSFIAFVLLIFLVSFNGCDELQSLPLNVPIPFEFIAQGSSSSSQETETVCISSVQELLDNQDKIKDVKFINAAYWTVAATPGLRGNITFALQTQSGIPIFSINLPNVSVEDYIGAPLVLSLSETEIQLFETYLGNFINNNDCFTASLSITNITTNQGTSHSLEGRVELVIEAEVEF